MAQLVALEAAMGEMEAARATFEAKARRVSGELAKLQQQVEDSNSLIARERRAIIGEERKRRRRSGDKIHTWRHLRGSTATLVRRHSCIHCHRSARANAVLSAQERSETSSR